MKIFLKKYSVFFLLFILVFSITYLSFYNYKIQNNLLLKQMENDAEDIAYSISASMHHFEDIKTTVNLQKLISDLSIGLEIFDFRFMHPDGVIRNSMFKDEINQVNKANSFKKVLQGDKKLKTFFFEVRDFVNVMAIYYPIYSDFNLIGIIDLSVDVSEHKKMSNSALNQRKVDVSNLLKSIDNSIVNSIKVIKETDTNEFLKAHVDFAENIDEISQVDYDDIVLFSSNEKSIGKKFVKADTKISELATINDRLFYSTFIEDEGNTSKTILLINAAHYANNEQKLMQTALLTSAIALFIALFMAIGIYKSAIERSREEKEQLELLVKERTYEIELLSKTDALTRLWNRGYLEEILNREFKRARRYGHDVSIMIIDLDHFKRVNDTYGHLAGDEVLRQVSKTIKNCVRDTDFVGRYGGEEIVVILPETKIEEAKVVANKILESIAKKPILFESDSISITASIGISKLDISHNEQKDLFNEADLALYNAKETGRNKIVLYDKELIKNS